MDKFRITEKPLFLKNGELELTEKQAVRRRYGLEPVKKKKGRYTIVKEVCFKVGEVVGMDQGLAKPLLKGGFIEPEDKAAAEAKGLSKNLSP